MTIHIQILRVLINYHFGYYVLLLLMVHFLGNNVFSVLRIPTNALQSVRWRAAMKATRVAMKATRVAMKATTVATVQMSKCMLHADVMVKKCS